MAEFLSKLTKGVRTCKPDTLVILLLVAWWLLNLVQAGLMGLANDEVYYWYYAKHLDWGYFDHPPMVALLIQLSQWLHGGLGIRFATTLLQPVYLWMFWRLLRPKNPEWRDAICYVLICFSQPLLQLYGVLALPDAPLMLFTVAFLWSHKRLNENCNMANATLMGICIALLGYSKYHGALVVALALLSTPSLLKHWQVYWAGVVAAVLFFPHIWWQYTHEWASLQYHLVGRNAWGYKLGFTTEYILTLLVLFNPLWLFHYTKGLRQKGMVECSWQMSTTLKVVLYGTLIFFLIATFRGRVQAQWLLPAVFPLTAALFAAGRRSKYVQIASLCTALFFVIVRGLAIVNPLHLKGEIWGQKEFYTCIGDHMGDRPLVLMHNYAATAKYIYYTGKPAYCAPYFYNRHSQWQFDTTDRSFARQEVSVGDFGEFRGTEFSLPDGHRFCYRTFQDYLPTRELKVTPLEPLNLVMTRMQGGSIPFSFPTTIAVENPYHYDIYSKEDAPIYINFYLQNAANNAPRFSAPLTDTLRARSKTIISSTLTLNRAVQEGFHTAGYAIGYATVPPSDNSKKFRVAVSMTADTLIIKQQQ